MLKYINKFRLAFGGAIAVIAGIVFGNDPDQLKKWVCVITASHYCWPVAKPVVPMPLTPLPPADTSGSPQPALPFVPGALPSERKPVSPPVVEASGRLESRPSGASAMVYLHVKIRVTNPGDEPIRVAWAPPREYSRVLLGGSKPMPFNWLRQDRPTGVTACGTAPDLCWSRYAADFATIPAKGTIVGTMVFRVQMPNIEVNDTMALETFDFIAKLILAKDEQTVPDVLDVALERQAIVR